MGKALEGIAVLGAAVGMGVAAFLDPALVASPLFDKIMEDLVVTGISMEAGAIASALASNRGAGITVRQPAAYRQVIYGEMRVGGVLVYISSTGSGPGILNQVTVVAGHEITAWVNLYLDGKTVFWDTSDGNAANQTLNNFNWGGWANSNTYIAPNGDHYSFGSNVFASGHIGNQVSGDVDYNLTANDPNWAASANGNPYLGGCAYFYLHTLYSTSLFPNLLPEVRVTVQGKQVYDPRTGTTGYSNNWALVVADTLMNTQYGLGVPMSAINTDAWIAAANISDEQVALANGNTEARYTINCNFDTSSDPGDILQSMMMAGAGRIACIGGQWFFWPGAWVGPSLTFDENSLTGAVEWSQYRSYRDLINRCSGTYVAPNYPYNVNVGGDSIYDNNGFAPDGSEQDNFELAYQPTSIPPYACDVQHGYATDAFLTADGNVELWKNYDLKMVTSISQAQRLLKIYLTRNRQQGCGKLPLMASAWQCQPNDVISMNFAPLGWSEKTLEVCGVHMQVNTQQGMSDQDTAPSITCPLDVQETDPSVYAWSTTEELTIYDLPAGLGGVPSVVAVPTDLTLTSGAATAVTGLDGVTTPRIMVTWTSPLDAWVTSIQVQYKLHSSSAWLDAGSTDVANLSAFIVGVVAGQVYDVRIRSVRGQNGATSVWLEQDSYTVSTTYSSITSDGIVPGAPWNVSNDAVVDSIDGGTSATVRIYGPGGVGAAWDSINGQGTTTYPAASITGIGYSTAVIVVYDTLTSTYLVQTSYSSSLSDSYIILGSLTTCAAGGTGGTSGGGSGTGGGGPRNPTYV
jgi:hypothetical protein